MSNITSLKEQKYKDSLPYHTIHKIRSKLLEVGILTTESGWLNSLDGFYSVTVSVHNSSVQTNGKGTTKAFALASAYGELMERLQNFAPFRLSMDFDADVFEHGSFYYTPDEVDLTVHELLNADNEWLDRVMRDSQVDNQSAIPILKKWQGISYEEVPSDYKAIPYRNIKSGAVSYIPIKLASKMYMSNGMCAGNTRAEALIQGISEIFERYVNQKIIRDHLTPPTIPESYLYEYQSIMSMIHRIESQGQFKIILKDCSLGKGYPVTCVIFIDQRTSAYFIKFGASPIFEISLERTLTELLQGQNIHKMKGLKEFHATLPVKDMDENIMNILVNGSGYYPKEMFMDTPTYPWKGFHHISGDTNEAILDQYITFIESLGYNVLVRDVSFLDFPAYHVIIPGLSEVECFDNVISINDYSIYNTIKKQVRRLAKLSPNEVRNLIYLITSRTYHPMADIKTLLGLRLNEQLPWYLSHISLLLVALYLYINDYDNASKSFGSFLDYAKQMYKKGTILTYYKCVNSYLDLRAQDVNQEEIYKLLVTIYPHKIVAKVIQEFENTLTLFKDMPGLNCYNCDTCAYKATCNYPGNRELIIKLKELYGTYYQQHKSE